MKRARSPSPPASGPPSTEALGCYFLNRLPPELRCITYLFCDGQSLARLALACRVVNSEILSVVRRGPFTGHFDAVASPYKLSDQWHSIYCDLYSMRGRSIARTFFDVLNFYNILSLSFIDGVRFSSISSDFTWVSSKGRITLRGSRFGSDVCIKISKKRDSFPSVALSVCDAFPLSSEKHSSLLRDLTPFLPRWVTPKSALRLNFQFKIKCYEATGPTRWPGLLFLNTSSVLTDIRFGNVMLFFPDDVQAWIEKCERLEASVFALIDTGPSYHRLFESIKDSWTRLI